jgi:hypothetical protein
MFKKIVLPLVLLAAGGISVAFLLGSGPSPAASGASAVRPANPCAVQPRNPCAVQPRNPCAPRPVNPCAVRPANPCAVR